MSTNPKYSANMVLPKGGKQAWTDIMQSDPPSAPDQINNGSPIVMAYARFEDGTQVVGGVYKWDDPRSPMNIKFMWVFDASGKQYPGWPIDVSDNEDFLQKAYSFSLTEGVDEEYLLNIVEAEA